MISSIKYAEQKERKKAREIPHPIQPDELPRSFSLDRFLRGYFLQQSVIGQSGTKADTKKKREKR